MATEQIIWDVRRYCWDVKYHAVVYLVVYSIRDWLVALNRRVQENEVTMPQRRICKACGEFRHECACKTPSIGLSSITVLMAAAVQLHELKQSLVEAGFTDDEAMTLVVAILTKTNDGD